VSDLKDAWDALQAMTPSGWYVGRPSYHLERDQWLLYALDPSERAVVGSGAVSGRRRRRRRSA
jgi:hypothetical protein